MNKIVLDALTFDDILMLPAYSEVVPNEVDISTYLTPDIKLNIPLVSAAMDTVTESRMAICIARVGGIGIIHKNMSIERQCLEVEKVKKSESGMIVDPVFIEEGVTIRKALEIMATYKVSGLPVVKEGILIGIVTNRDVLFIEDNDLDCKVSEVMTRDNLVTVPPGTSLDEAKKILHKNKIEKLPVVDDQNRLKGLITIKDIEKIIKYPHSCKDYLGRLRVGAAIGAGSDLKERSAALVKAGVDVLVLDSAHGHSMNILKGIEYIKSEFPNVQVIGGNVATYEGAKALIKAGADTVKVGIGPGSICTTRIVAGVGVPQITAIMESARAAREFGKCIIADGGIRYSGDIVKAIGCGADAVMMGGIFAGTEESPGETLLYHGRKYKSYRGMGSIDAMKSGSSDRYFQEKNAKLVPEGIVGRVAYKGDVGDVIFQMVGGLRSGMGYAGCESITKLKESAQFVKISNAGYRESHVHDVDITKEAPNYQV